MGPVFGTPFYAKPQVSKHFRLDILLQKRQFLEPFKYQLIYQNSLFHTGCPIFPITVLELHQKV